MERWNIFSIGQKQLTQWEERLLLSARVGYRWDKWNLYIYRGNLLDQDFAYSRVDQTTFSAPNPVGRVNQPLTVGIGLTREW